MGGRISVVALAVVVSAALAAPAAYGEALIPNTGGFGSSAIYATAPAGDTRLFVVERGGGIRIIKNGVVQATPFLTVPNVDTSGERGLLSMAFAPDYATSGLFYVFKVSSADAGQLQVVEYHVSANPDVAEPSSARIVLRQRHDQASNHNGGQLLFGPDDVLYIDFGDGGSTPGNGQETKSLLGKILRIDPRLQPGGAPYGIPADNPFAGNARCGPEAGSAPCPEIFTIGLRNPFRASFDRLNGDFIIGDVGSGTWEEIDVGRHSGLRPGDNSLRGANLGWATCEGNHNNGSTDPGCTDLPTQTPPFFEYQHVGQPCYAEIGGFVVRDPTLTNLVGRYLYGDSCTTDLRTLDLGVSGGDPQSANLVIPSGALYSFGEDAGGCVYAVSNTTVYRVAASAAEPFACPNAPSDRFSGLGPPAGPPPILPPSPPGGGETGGGATGGGGDTPSTGGGSAGGDTSTPPLLVDVTPPALRLARSSIRQRLDARRAVRVTLACDEDCTLAATGRLSLASGAAATKRLRGATARLAAGDRRTLRLNLSRAQAKRARRVLERGGRATAAVTVTARDTAGNTSRTVRNIVLRYDA